MTTSVIAVWAIMFWNGHFLSWSRYDPRVEYASKAACERQLEPLKGRPNKAGHGYVCEELAVRVTVPAKP